MWTWVLKKKKQVEILKKFGNGEWLVSKYIVQNSRKPIKSLKEQAILKQNKEKNFYGGLVGLLVVDSFELQNRML